MSSADAPSRPNNQAAPRRRDASLLIGIVLAFLAVRVPSLNNAPSTEVTEHLEYGVLARLTLEGIDAPISALKPFPHEGGSLLLGPCCVPVYVAFGPSEWSLRLCNLLWHAATLAVFAGIALLLLGRLPALLFGLVWTLAPPEPIRLMQHGWANHLETGLLAGFGLLGLVLALRSERRANAWLVAGGCAVGLSVFFHFSALPAAAALGLLVLVARRVRRIRVGAAVLGVLIGLSPLLWTGGYTDRMSWDRAGEKLGVLLISGSADSIGSERSPMERGAYLATELAPRLWGLRNVDRPVRVRGETLNLLYGGLLVAAALVGTALALRRRRTAPIAALVLGGCALVLLAHVAGVIVSGVEVSRPRYLLPVLPFLVLLAAGGAAAPTSRGRGLGVALALSAASLICLPSWMERETRNAADDRLPPGLDDWWLGGRLVDHTGFVIWFTGQPAPARAAMVREAGRGRADLLTLHGEATGLVGGVGPGSGLDERLDALGRSWFLEGFAGARVLPHGLESEHLPRLSALLARLGSVTDDPSEREHLTFGAAWRLLSQIEGRVELRDTHVTDPSLAPEHRRATCRAVGAWDAWRRFALLGVEEQRVPQGCSREDYAAGIGIGVARNAARLDAPIPGWLRAGRIAPQTFDATAERGFRCALEAEMGRLRALQGQDSGSASVDPLTDC